MTGDFGQNEVSAFFKLTILLDAVFDGASDSGVKKIKFHRYDLQKSVLA